MARKHYPRTPEQAQSTRFDNAANSRGATDQDYVDLVKQHIAVIALNEFGGDRSRVRCPQDMFAWREAWPPLPTLESLTFDRRLGGDKWTAAQFI